MPLIKDIDTFILESTSLLKSVPSSTITLSYTHTKSGKSQVKFKITSPQHGLNYQYQTRKHKDFAKLCNALGPRGCNVGDVGEIDGLSLLLMNTAREEVVPLEQPSENVTKPEQQPEAQEAPAATSSKKKSKKKGKK